MEKVGIGLEVYCSVQRTQKKKVVLDITAYNSAGPTC